MIEVVQATGSPLRRRFRAAAAAAPLSALAAHDAAELDALLDRTEAFEDLPGRWQAALLAAEAGGGAAPTGCGCCGGAPSS